MKKYLVIAFKLAFSVTLLFYLVCMANLSAVVDICLRVNIFDFLVVVSLCILSLEVSCYKWQRLLRHDHIFCSLWQLTRIYLIGYYFNNFLPTSIGGDAARAYWLGNDRRKLLEVLTSIFVERVSGVLALLPIGLAGLMLAPGMTDSRQRAVLAWGSLALLLLFVAAVAAARSGWIRRMNLPEKVQGHLGRITRSFSCYLSDKGTLFNLVWTSVLFQLLVVLIYYQAGRALELDLPVVVLLAVVPLVTLLTLLPISFNGLGLREGGFVFFLAQAGFEKSEALSLSLFVYGISVLFSMAGWVGLHSKTQVKRAKHEIE
jgi:hypothetical protein